MKKLLFFLLIIFASSPIIQSAPYPSWADKTPDIVGFRDMKWGDSIELFSSELIQIHPRKEIMEPSKIAKEKHYIKKHENLQIGDANIERIEYTFVSGKFSDVTIYTDNYFDWLLLRDYIVTTYQSDSKLNTWFRKSGYILTDYLNFKTPEHGQTIFSSNKLID